MAYADTGRYERAIRDFDQALRLDPDYARAYFNRGLAYARGDQHDRARSDFQKALTLGYDRVTVEAMLARLP